MQIPIISDIFGWLFKGLYGISSQNYLLTLFLFAVIMKIVLLPFGIKQQKNSVKQARLRPKEIAIRNKYKGRNDKATQQKQSEEIMKLYQEENVNPMAGCLPMLIQLPILFALYGVITRPITYISNISKDTVVAIQKAYTAGLKAFDLKQSGSGVEIDIINKLTSGKYDFGQFFEGSEEAWNSAVSELTEIGASFNVFGLDLSVAPQEKWGIYILIPVLTFVFSYLSTKLIRKFTYQAQVTDSSTQASMGMMDLMMPLLSVYISVIMSSALGIYWMFQNILSGAQQMLLYKLYPVPVVTEEQIKEAELQLKGKSKQHKEKNVVLSDDDIDDYDKTVKTDKSADSKKKKEGIISARKIGINPKVKELYKNGRKLKARKKI